MTLEEAINHCEEVANDNDDCAKEFYRASKLVTYPYRKGAEYGYFKCKKCAYEHRQLAEWLHKYQKIKEIYDNWNVDFGVETHRAMIKIGVVLNGNDEPGSN